MKKLIKILIVASLMLAVMPVTAFSHTASDPFVTDLTAGGGNIKSAMDVGDVKVWNDGDYLYVEYVVTEEDWCLTETHLEVTTVLADIPQKNGNPRPGQFAYENEHDCVANWIYQIPLDWGPGTEILIAAHGVVQTESADGLDAMLPDQVTIAVAHPGLGFGAPSYFDITVFGGTNLDGMYDGYSIVPDLGITGDTANVYSSYEALPSSVPIDYPENLDLVNWIINQDFVGQPSGCDGNYTYGDVQWAIWKLVTDSLPADLSSLGDWSECRAQEIRGAAYANGEGFVPACNDVIGIILEPVEDGQSVLIWVDIPCEDKTAWGGDYFGTPLEFPGNNWAIYFAYTVQ